MELGWATAMSRERLLQAFHEQGPVSGFERQFVCKDGSSIRSSSRRFPSKSMANYRSSRLPRTFRARRKAEEALRLNEELLRTIIDIAPIGLSVVDKNGRLVLMNSRVSSLLDITQDGVNTGQYQGRRYVRADGSPMPTSEYASNRARPRDAIADVEIGVIKEDGQRIWALTHAAPLPDGGWCWRCKTSGIASAPRRNCGYMPESWSSSSTKLLSQLGSCDWAIPSLSMSTMPLSVYLVIRARKRLARPPSSWGCAPILKRAPLCSLAAAPAAASSTPRCSCRPAAESCQTVLINMSTLEMADEKFYIATAEDITERTRAAEALKASG